MPQLDFSTYIGQLIGLFFSFIALYVFVQYVFFPKIEIAINSRDAFIKKNLRIAEASLNSAKEIKTSNDLKLREANEEALELYVETEKEIKLAFDMKIVENENAIASLLRKKTSELIDIRNTEINQIASDVIDELKNHIIIALIQNSVYRKHYDS